MTKKVGRPPVITDWGYCYDHECFLPVVRRGFCQTHSLRWHKKGDPQWDIPIISPRRPKGSGLDVERDILAHLVSSPAGCLTWPYAKYSDGRGHIKEGQVHKIVWVHYNGPVPDGLQINHRCGNGHLACADVRHLYAGTQLENMQDARDQGVPLGWHAHKNKIPARA